MGTVTIHPETTTTPISMIGEFAGECWGSNTKDTLKNYNRGLECLQSQHGRTFEFPDVYMTLDGYSARVIREWYTHIGGSPTRLQASTRYINYKNFKYVTPPSIENDLAKRVFYEQSMKKISEMFTQLEEKGVPKEDCALLLPLGMETKIVCKHNLRNLMDMSHQRMCNRAYWEYRQLFNDICDALSSYSTQWQTIVNDYFEPKCEYLGRCPEKNSCGYFSN